MSSNHEILGQVEMIFLSGQIESQRANYSLKKV